MKTKKLDWLLENEDNFASLLGMVLLFDKNSEWNEYSGFVTAALLDFDDPENKISILAIHCGVRGLFTFKRTREELNDILLNCVEFVGEDEESSFILENYDK